MKNEDFNKAAMIIAIVAVLFVFCSFCTSCIPTEIKPIWSISSCEVYVANKCFSFCKLNKSVVKDFVRMPQHYLCECERDMEARYSGLCQ